MPNAQRVQEIVRDCLYTNEELVSFDDGAAPDDTIIVEGIIATFGFHPGRLESHRDEVKAMLAEMPDQFMKNGGGGWSFLQMPFDREGNHWAEQPTAGDLVVLGIGLGYVRYLMQRELWAAMPGSVPYLVIDLDPQPASEEVT